MTYEYTNGMGRVVPQQLPMPVGSGAPRPPAGQPRPQGYWRGNFTDCKQQGGSVSWRGSSATNELSWAPSIGSDAAIRQHISLTGCYGSGNLRIPESQAQPGQTIARVVSREYETCCYPQSFMQQKQVEMQAQAAAYQASLEAYRNSPAYKEYEKERADWQDQQRYAAQIQDRARRLASNKATAKPGDPCSPPDGGVVGKLHVPIPRTGVEQAEQRLAMMRFVEAGCSSEEKLYDLENVQICCPPDVQVGPPAIVEPIVEPVVEPTPASVEKTYFGLTTKQLMFVGLGGAALYLLMSRKG